MSDQNQEVALVERKIEVFSTVGNNEYSVTTNVKTFGELKPLLAAEGVTNFEGMDFVVSETETELRSDNSVLPTTPFTLFLLPRKSKAGNDELSLEEVDEMSQDECKAYLERYIDMNLHHPDYNQEDFLFEGVSYRFCSVEIMRDMIRKTINEPFVEIIPDVTTPCGVAFPAEEMDRWKEIANGLEPEAKARLLESVQSIIDGKDDAQIMQDLSAQMMQDLSAQMMQDLSAQMIQSSENFAAKSKTVADFAEVYRLQTVIAMRLVSNPQNFQPKPLTEEEKAENIERANRAQRAQELMNRG